MNNQFSSNQKVTVLPTPDAVVHAAVDVKSTEQTQSTTSQVAGTDASARAHAGRGPGIYLIGLDGQRWYSRVVICALKALHEAQNGNL